ncbi:MAG: FG-GAP repeat protein, partial [Caldilineaceae bacterium]
VGANSGEGSAYVFTRSGTTWNLQETLHAPDGTQWEYFGISVALSGNTALVGATGADYSRGAAYAFTRSDTDWGLQQKLTAAGGAVALSGDTALVGVATEQVKLLIS